nr:HU family DNA-binding protein [Candidatus Microthrix sp.]
MNKSELVSTIARRTEMSEKDVNAVLGEFITVVGEVVAGKDKLTIPGFISFEQTERRPAWFATRRPASRSRFPATKAVKISAWLQAEEDRQGRRDP